MAYRLGITLLLLIAACGGSADPASPASPASPDGGSAASGSGGADAAATTPDPDAGTRTVDLSAIDWTVNGHLLTGQEQAAVVVIGTDVVPRLDGDRDARLTFAAQGAWWALKEGTWEQSLAAVYGYSNCNSSAGDHTIGPTEICGTGRAWQVGLAAVQVPGHTVTELEALVPQLFPGTTSTALLADVAAKAGVTSTSTTAAITGSTGSLRASWLLRVPAIGFLSLVPQEVVTECIDGSKSWCFGTGWDETKKFAPTKAASTVSMTDLRGILAQIAP